jgi:hypothetical protein
MIENILQSEQTPINPFTEIGSSDFEEFATTKGCPVSE